MAGVGVGGSEKGVEMLQWRPGEVAIGEGFG